VPCHPVCRVKFLSKTQPSSVFKTQFHMAT
jgi:hypothetical protein